MRLSGRQHSRTVLASTAAGIFTGLLVAAPVALASFTLTASRPKPCAHISTCTASLSTPVAPTAPAPTGTPPPQPPSSHFGIAVKPALTATLVKKNQSGQLIAKLDPGHQVTCAGYKKRDPATLVFQLLTPSPLRISYVITDRIVNVNANGIQFCLGAHFHFKTLSGAPAAPTVLPDGTKGYVGLLPTCPNPSLAPGATTASCLAGVATTPDSSSSTGVDVIVTARIPVLTTAAAGDPWGGS